MVFPRKNIFKTDFGNLGFTEKNCSTQKFLHTNVSYTDQLLHGAAFAHRSFYTQKPLHIRASTQKSHYTEQILHRNAFTRSSCYTEVFYTQAPSHTGAGQVLHIDAYTQRNLYDLYTQRLSHRKSFMHRTFYAQRILHTDVFEHTQKLSHTEKPLDKEAFTEQCL